MTIFQTRGGTITYDASKRIMVAEFTGFMNSKRFREFMQAGLAALKEKLHSGNVMWLADTRNHKVIRREDTDWVAQSWTPEAVKAGLTHIAFVLPKDAFAEMSVNNYQQKVQVVGNLTIQNFDAVENAEKWYLSCQEALSV